MPKAATEPLTKCPYTGEHFEIEMLPGLGAGSGYTVVGAFDPCQWFNNEYEAMAALSMRNGIQREYKRLRCPYTGKSVELITHPGTGRVRASGCFTPCQIFPTQEAAEDAMSTRMGVKPQIKRPVIKVGEVAEPRPSTCDDLGKIGDKMVEHIEEFLNEEGT